MAVLELKKLKKYYDKTCGIEDVSLKLNKGEIYGFIGPNGAGKSTTLRTIMGLINKTSGSILFNDEELDINNEEIKRNIGYLPSEINLYEDMTIKQLLNYHESFYKKDLSKRRKELINLFKIEENKKIEALSLGNLKKIGIVLAFLHNPEIILLDEPTSGLDPIMQNNFHKLILKEKEKGTTILYSSHILSEISNICDKVGFIKDGKIIKEDNMENIKKENYTYLKITSKDITKIKKDIKLQIISETETEVVFLNNLEANKIISILGKYNIEKLIIEEIPLEDLFLNYYK